MENNQANLPIDNANPSDPLAPFTKGTLLAGIRTPLHKVLTTADRFVCAEGGIRAEELGSAVGIAIPEAKELLHIFRKAMALRPEDQLDGTAEIDDGVLDLGSFGDKDKAHIPVVIAVEKRAESNRHIAFTALASGLELSDFTIDTQTIKNGSTVEMRRPDTFGRALVDRNCKVVPVGKAGMYSVFPALPHCAEVFARTVEILKTKYWGEIRTDNAQEHLDEIAYRWPHRLNMKRAVDGLIRRLSTKEPRRAPIIIEFRNDPNATP